MSVSVSYLLFECRNDVNGTGWNVSVFFVRSFVVSFLRFFDQLKPNFIALGLEEENVISFDENKSFLRTGVDGEKERDDLENLQ